VLRNALAAEHERQGVAPDDPEPFRRAGRILLLLGEVWTAQAALETAIAIDSRRLKKAEGGPDEWKIRWSLAKSHHAIGHHAAAVEEIARARELAPDEPTREEISRWLSWEERRAWLVEVDEAERDRIVMTVAVEV
jgi:tetratricopeptide (TPR) repeat protein